VACATWVPVGRGEGLTNNPWSGLPDEADASTGLGLEQRTAERIGGRRGWFTGAVKVGRQQGKNTGTSTGIV